MASPEEVRNQFDMTPYEEYSNEGMPLNLFQRLSKRVSGQIPQPVAVAPQGQPVEAPAPPPVQGPPSPPLSLKPDFSGLMHDSPEEKAYKAALRKQLGESRSAQVKSADELQKQYDAFGNTKDFDLTNVLSGLDFFSGANAAAGYKAPKSEDEIRKEKAGIAKMLQEARAGISDVDLKNLKMSSDDKANQKYIEMMMRQQRSDQGKGAEFVKQYQQDPDVKHIRDNMAGTNDLRTLINSESKTGYQGIGTKLAKAMGASPISNFDVKNLSGPPDFKSQMERTWNKAVNGDLTPGDLDDYRKLLKAIDDYNQGALEYHNNRYINEIGPGIYGVPPELGKRVVVSGGGYHPPAPATAKPTAPGATPGNAPKKYYKMPDGTIQEAK